MSFLPPAALPSFRFPPSAPGRRTGSEGRLTVNAGQTRAVGETKAIFGPLKQRTEDALAKLEEQIALAESAGTASDVQLTAAKEALKQGREAVAKEDDN